MRKLAVLLLVVALAVCVVVQSDATTRRPHGAGETWGGVNGYAGIVDSTWNSSSNPAAAGYTTVVAPTNQRFHLFKIYSNKIAGAASANELFYVRFWTSATDSTSIHSSVIPLRLQEHAAPLEFPVNAYKASFLSIGTSDSVTCLGYYK